MNYFLKNILVFSFVLLLCNCALYEKYTMSDAEREAMNKEKASQFAIGEKTTVPHEGAAKNVKIKSYNYKNGTAKVQIMDKTKSVIIVRIDDLGRGETSLQKAKRNTADAKEVTGNAKGMKDDTKSLFKW